MGLNLALCAFAAIDAFFPAVPSESLVITAGVFAATGEPSLAGVIGFSALGAFAGDPHLLPARAHRRRAAAAPREARLQAGQGLRAGLGRMLSERGATILIVCRYIPGARTAITLTAGAVAYRLRSFTLFDGIAALSWGTYCALVGYIGGEAFEDAPWKGLLLGLGIALAVTMTVELIRHLRRPRAVGP